jgi:hypothetical protein
MPKFNPRNPWGESQARFGENDYVDLLAPEAGVHPAQLLYHVPRWLRGFPGQHKANELVKLIHYRLVLNSSKEKNLISFQKPLQGEDAAKLSTSMASAVQANQVPSAISQLPKAGRIARRVETWFVATRAGFLFQG